MVGRDPANSSHQAPKGRRGVAAGGATPLWASGNPWNKSRTHTAPAGAEEVERALRRRVVYSRVVPYLLRRIVLAFYK